MQGKLVIGLDILPNELGDFRFISILYNAIFGNGVSSKLFQIVREKESLAYTAKSEYIAQKNNIFIRCGIECQNYEKATELIKKLLEDMKNGEFSEEDITKPPVTLVPFIYKVILFPLETLLEEREIV